MGVVGKEVAIFGEAREMKADLPVPCWKPAIWPSTRSSCRWATTTPVRSPGCFASAWVSAKARIGAATSLSMPELRLETLLQSFHTTRNQAVLAALKTTLPTQLALTWNDRVSFVLTDGGQLRKMKMLDVVVNEAENRKSKDDDNFDVPRRAHRFPACARSSTNALQSAGASGHQPRRCLAEPDCPLPGHGRGWEQGRGRPLRDEQTGETMGKTQRLGHLRAAPLPPPDVNAPPNSPGTPTP